MPKDTELAARADRTDKEMLAQKKAEEEKRKADSRESDRAVVEARAIDYIPSEYDKEKEKEILGEGAALYAAGKVNPAFVGIVGEAERFKRYGDLFAAIAYAKSQYQGMLDGLTPDLAQAKEKAKDYVTKPEVSRGALDELQRRGAVQLAEPEAPSMWNAATQMWTGAIAQAFQNINQSELSAAEAQQTTEVVAANSAAYQAAEFASFKQNRQRVLEINAQLQAKYQDDLITAMRDYETRADAAAWNYEQQLLNAAFNEQRQWYDLFNKVNEFDQEVGKIKADIGMGYLRDKQRAGEINVQIRNRAEEFNAKLRSEIQASTMRAINENRRFREKLYEMGMQKYGKKLEVASMTANGLGASGATLVNNVQQAVFQYDLSPLTDEGRANSDMVQRHAAGYRVLMNRLNQRISEMYPDDKQKLDRQNALGRAVESLQLLNNEGYALRSANVSDETLNTLINGGIAAALHATNINKSNLPDEDFYTPDNVGGENARARLKRYTDMSGIALTEILWEYGNSQMKQRQTIGWGSQLPPEKK